MLTTGKKNFLQEICKKTFFLITNLNCRRVQVVPLCYKQWNSRWHHVSARMAFLAGKSCKCCNRSSARWRASAALHGSSALDPRRWVLRRNRSIPQTGHQNNEGSMVFHLSLCNVGHLVVFRIRNTRNVSCAMPFLQLLYIRRLKLSAKNNTNDKNMKLRQSFKPLQLMRRNIG